MNGGHLSPYEAFWLNRQIPRWCAVLSLRSDPAGTVAEPEDHRFVVDLDGAAGLARPSRSPAGMPRYLDTAPMLALIRDEIASLRDPARPVDRSSPLRRGRQLKLLGSPQVKLGDAIEIQDAPRPELNGLFKVVAVRHVLNKCDGFVTWVSFTRPTVRTYR